MSSVWHEQQLSIIWALCILVHVQKKRVCMHLNFTVTFSFLHSLLVVCIWFFTKLLSSVQTSINILGKITNYLVSGSDTFLCLCAIIIVTTLFFHLYVFSKALNRDHDCNYYSSVPIMIGLIILGIFLVTSLVFIWVWRKWGRDGRLPDQEETPAEKYVKEYPSVQYHKGVGEDSLNTA